MSFTKSPPTDLLQQARHAIQQKAWQEAYALLAELLAKDAKSATGYALMAHIQQEHQQLHKAKALFAHAFKLQPKLEYRVQLIKLCSQLAQMHEVKQLCKPLNAQLIEQALWADTLGVALTRLGDHSAALPYFEKATRLEPNVASYHYNYGVSLKFYGDFAKAEQEFKLALAEKPNYAAAWYARSELADKTQAIAWQPTLAALLTEANTVDEQLTLSHALARSYEAGQDYNLALTTLHLAKAQKRLTSVSQKDALLQLLPALTDLAKSQQDTVKAGSDSKEPIFIVGMPRSGTTLVERILSSHSQVQSAGELQDFATAIKELSQTPGALVLDSQTVQAAYQLDPCQIASTYLNRTRVLTGQQAHFIDKLPFNFFYIDLIRRAFPSAKIIWMLRNPADTCLGNYRALFSLQNPYYSYVFSLEDTASFYAEFYQFTRYWQAQKLPQIRFQSYEALVENPEQQTQQLLDFCELTSETLCFQSEQNQAPVATASKVQVREPINRSALNRFARYQPAITPLLEALSEKRVPTTWQDH